MLGTLWWGYPQGNTRSDFFGLPIQSKAIFQNLPWLGIEIYVSNISISSKNILFDVGLIRDALFSFFTTMDGCGVLLVFFSIICTWKFHYPKTIKERRGKWRKLLTSTILHCEWPTNDIKDDKCYGRKIGSKIKVEKCSFEENA